ncbi:MAG: glycosyltransferase family 2 protein [Pyrinomonadaceae bacterium]|nr:glycosyltransferase family 2 protein [Pyrinomonadaceae bacterium]
MKVIKLEPELSVIIVNWNGGELLRQCLRSLAQYPPSLAYEVIVVDNGSTDESLKWLESPEPGALFGETPFRIIKNADNHGFAKANNQAIAASDSPMVFLLNSDADVTAGAIDTLIATLRSEPRIGAVGPRLLNTDGTLQHSVWRNPPTVREILLNGLGVWRLLPKYVRGELLLGGHWDHDRKREVPMLFGAAVLARRAMIDEVGALDERFHMYSEDIEWCLRIVRGGWSLMFDPAAVVRHHGGQSALKRWTSSEKRRLQLDTYFQFQQYALPRRQVIANQLANYLVACGQKAWRLLRGSPTADIQVVLDAHRDHLKRALSKEAATLRR